VEEFEKVEEEEREEEVDELEAERRTVEW